MCERCERRAERDREMWLAIARALGTVSNGITGVIRAIERRHAADDNRRAA